jgi:uncharacterized tellurite resistance protein B-like protein
MMEADGQVSAKEEVVMADIMAAIESVNVGVLGRLFKGVTGHHAQVVANAPNREDYFQDFVNNKVYYGVRRRLDMGETELNVGEDTLRTLSLAGGIMAQVARVNPRVTDAEVDTMVGALQTYWHLKPEEAAFVVEVAVSETASLLDQSRLVREFADACGPRERAEFLDVLFAVAAADGEASYDEIEELRTIARWLKLSHEQFIEAKLKIPHEQRGQ